MTSLRHNITALLFALGLTLGIAIGVVVPLVLADPVSNQDLVPAGANNCLVQAKETLGLLDRNSIGDFTAPEIDELRILPERCNERAVSEALYDQYPLLMAKLETIGT